MKTSKKIIFTILLVICGGILCGVKIYGSMLVHEAIKLSIDAFQHKIHPFLIYKEVWEVDIPEANANLEYYFSDIVWLDGERYSTIKFDVRPDEFLQSFSNDETSDFDMNRCENAIDRLVKYGIDESKVVYPQEKFLYYSKNKNNGNDMIFLYYAEDVKMLYIVEDFT